MKVPVARELQVLPSVSREAMTETPSLRPILAVIFLVVALLSPARGSLVKQALGDVGLNPPAGARLPLDQTWHDEHGGAMTLRTAAAGKPALVLFADYTCSTLCGPSLAFVSDALAKTRLGIDSYRLLVLGLDPKDGAAAATAFRKAQADVLGLPIVMLSAPEATVKAATAAVGYRYVYDAERDQYAHPAAVIAMAPDGRIVRALSSLGFNAKDLTLAMTEAGEGRIGSLVDQVRLLCYGFDPAAGTYNFAVRRALAASAVVTLVGLGLGIGWLAWSTRRS
jgi:protein SCO1/2